MALKSLDPRVRGDDGVEWRGETRLSRNLRAIKPTYREPTYRHSRERGLCFTSAKPNIQGFIEA
ncbi:hypothetical protein [Lysobacter enzymogenes]|uniref:Uncharacterized protein n=1 Tax=Lysobacter enzymogenes TaxID=69 RepID=A0AAU9AQ05_LYSEN|nr:hypothetical protein [Lysobacter enzymogenes]BAV99478.1 hypothetical protein LEN_3991 [Lysobacter enzymogenes]